MKHTNLLINSSSPYLLQHAHNPVNWHPYGDEAFAKAAEEDKPLIISIGYSACHWCHVMERESFENEQVAATMNESFICIKVDREERPDVDQIYMDAVQLMTGSGGWPLNVFCTPAGKPFYGGTYFPPQSAHNRPSWITVLNSIKAAWLEKKDEVVEYAGSMIAHIKREERFYKPGTETASLSQGDAHKIFEHLITSADLIWGGFGSAPKFPSVPALKLLSAYHHYSKEEQALSHVLHSMRCMLHGGIYDHLAGGFARYSTDRTWLAPHFEKMLYDNALLLSLLADCYSITNDREFLSAIDLTVDFCCSTLRTNEGGFCGALDADSEGVEGKYYTWAKTEVEKVIGADAKLFCHYYDISEHGNWEQTNILHQPMALDAFCVREQLDKTSMLQVLESCRVKLLAARMERVPPGLDDKIILGWNALMCSALCKCYMSTGDSGYKEKALSNALFMLATFKSHAGGLHHTYKNGIAQFDAYLDDYAFLIEALINVYAITGEVDWLTEAARLTSFVETHFADSNDACFYYTADFQKDTVVRKKEFFDNATPSGNSIMMQNLFQLAIYLDNLDWETRALQMLRNMTDAVMRFPSSFGIWAQSLLTQINGSRQVVVTGVGAYEATAQLQSHYLPGVQWALAVEPNNLPLFMGKSFDRLNIYVCHKNTCMAPVTNVEDALKILLPQS